MKEKLKLVFNWIKNGRKATYEILQATTSYFKSIKKTHGLYNLYMMYQK